ncbi:MAG TPA: hypothetical protein VFB28_01095 [Terriglobales bacterium]|nr:hypothetical protein [Terriglobales bacterium]
MNVSCRVTCGLAVALLLGTVAVAQMGTDPNASQNANGTQNNQPYNANNAGQNSNGQPTVLVDPGKIYNQDPTGWVGKRVVLQNVMVEDADKAGNFWVGSDKNHRLLIVKSKNNPNLSAKMFHKGDIVTITGTIHPAGDAEAQETDASSGKMKKARESSGVFLLADDVDIASSTQHK